MLLPLPLLHRVRGPLSFENLKILNGQELGTFRNACRQLGLLQNDVFLNDTLQEAAVAQALQEAAVAQALQEASH